MVFLKCVSCNGKLAVLYLITFNIFREKYLCYKYIHFLHNKKTTISINSKLKEMGKTVVVLSVY